MPRAPKVWPKDKMTVRMTGALVPGPDPTGPRRTAPLS